MSQQQRGEGRNSALPPHTPPGPGRQGNNGSRNNTPNNQQGNNRNRNNSNGNHDNNNSGGGNNKGDNRNQNRGGNNDHNRNRNSRNNSFSQNNRGNSIFNNGSNFNTNNMPNHHGPTHSPGNTNNTQSHSISDNSGNPNTPDITNNSNNGTHTGNISILHNTSNTPSGTNTTTPSGTAITPSKKRHSTDPSFPTVERRVLAKTLETTAMSVSQAHAAARQLWLHGLRDSDIKMCYAVVNLAVQAQAPDHVATADMLYEFLDRVFDGLAAGQPLSPGGKDFHAEVEECSRRGCVGTSAAGASVDLVCTICTKTGQLTLHYSSAIHPVLPISDLQLVCWKSPSAVDAIKADVIARTVSSLVRSVRDHNTVLALQYARDVIAMPEGDTAHAERMRNIWPAAEGSSTAQNPMASKDASRYFPFVQGHCMLRNLPPGFPFDDEEIFPPRMVEGGVWAKLPSSVQGPQGGNGGGGNGNGFGIKGLASAGARPA